jgi:NAD(P)-dependent dehydrogenase (short-subunit alcohol dehydrogenase family)
MLEYVVLAAACCAVVLWLRHTLRVPGLHRRAVVITGCDTGFGRLLAIRLALRGQTVYAACFSKAVRFLTCFHFALVLQGADALREHIAQDSSSCML